MINLGGFGFRGSCGFGQIFLHLLRFNNCNASWNNIHPEVQWIIQSPKQMKVLKRSEAANEE